MKNIIVLQKEEDGSILCQQITEKGIEFYLGDNEDHEMWEDGGTITLDEIEEILNREI